MNEKSHLKKRHQSHDDEWRLFYNSKIINIKSRWHLTQKCTHTYKCMVYGGMLTAHGNGLAIYTMTIFSFFRWWRWWWWQYFPMLMCYNLPTFLAEAWTYIYMNKYKYTDVKVGHWFAIYILRGFFNWLFHCRIYALIWYIQHNLVISCDFRQNHPFWHSHSVAQDMAEQIMMIIINLIGTLLIVLDAFLVRADTGSMTE